MAVTFVICTSTAQANELFDAGLLWVNQDTSRNREYPNWQMASACHRWHTEHIDQRLEGEEPALYWCTDFAYALED